MEIRKIRVVGSVAYVPLTQGYEAIIDASDAHLVDGWNWSVKIDAHTIYARRGFKSKGKQHTVKMHRIILSAPDGVEVDHKDGDGLNNRRGNIRFATRSQNACNKRVQRNSASGLKGVFWRKNRHCWQAEIRINGKGKYLGNFATKEDACMAYANASKQLHGEYGRV